MRPPSTRAWAPATGTGGILGPEGGGNCYRLLSCHTALTTPRARVVEKSSRCPPRDGAGHSYLAWVLRESLFTSWG